MDNSEDGNNDLQAHQRAFPNSSQFSWQLKKTLGSLKASPNFLTVDQNDVGKATILGVPLSTPGGDILQKKMKLFMN